MHAPPDERRCTWIKATGSRCKQPRVADGDDPAETLCHYHVNTRLERARRWTLVEDTPDVPIDQHLTMELRASYVMVRVAELEMHDLGLDHSAFIHPTKETEKRDGDSESFVSVKRATIMGAHPLILTYLREREHHMNVLKTCIAAGLAARQIQAVERYVESLMTFAQTLVEELGHDPAESSVRAVIVRCMRTMEEAVVQNPGVDRKVIEG